MMKRFLALGLSCTLLLSLPVTASAARAGSSDPKPTSSQDWPVTYTTGSLSYDQIAGKVRSENITVDSLRESIDAMEAMDWDEAIDDLEDAIDDLEDSIDAMSGYSSTIQQLQTSINDALTNVGAVSGDIGGNITKLTQLSYLSSQTSSMQSTLDSLDDQLDDLKEQKKDYQKTVADTKRQIESSIDQLVTGAESLYMTIVSTELQIESLEATQTSTARSLRELELRYARGQISKLTLTQVQNGYDTIDMNLKKLDNAVTSMKLSLQSLMGDNPTGRVALAGAPSVNENQLNAISYTTDLAAAKEASYSLYSARRTVEDKEDDMDEARREEGKYSYQYKMASHNYDAAVLQEKAAIESFEVSFRNLYNALAPAQAAVTTAQSDYDYQKQVYASNQLKYQQGTISYNALLDAEDTMESARRDLESAQMDLFTAWQSYQNAVQYGLVSSSN